MMFFFLGLKSEHLANSLKIQTKISKRISQRKKIQDHQAKEIKHGKTLRGKKPVGEIKWVITLRLQGAEWFRFH
jgi:hypothetical protein